MDTIEYGQLFKRAGVAGIVDEKEVSILKREQSRIGSVIISYRVSCGTNGTDIEESKERGRKRFKNLCPILVIIIQKSVQIKGQELIIIINIKMYSMVYYTYKL